MKKQFASASCLFVALFLAACANIVPAQTSLPTLNGARVVYPSLIELKGLGSVKVLGFSFSPDGNTLILFSSHSVSFYTTSDGSLIAHIEGELQRGWHDSGVVSWSPDGTKFAVERHDGVWIFETQTWSLIEDKDACFWEKCADGPYSFGLAWSPDSQSLALAEQGKISIWNSSSHQWRETALTDKAAFANDAPFGMLWTAEGLQLFNQTRPSGLYDLETGTLMTPLQSGVDGIGEAWWSPDKKNAYIIFDLGASVLNLQTNEFTYGVCCYVKFAWSQDGRYLATTKHWDQEQPTINLWDTELKSEQQLEVDVNGIQALAWSPEGDLYALVGEGFRTLLSKVFTEEQ